MPDNVFFSFTLLLLAFHHGSFAQSLNGSNWQMWSPKKAGVEVEYFKVMEDSIQSGYFGEVHSVLVIKNGRLIFESYYNGSHRDSLHTLQSITKSITATGVGIAIQSGIIEGVHERILPVFRDKFEVRALNDNKKSLTLYDLMTMQAGFKWKEGAWNGPENSWRKIVEYKGNWYKKILDTPVTKVPGSMFEYQSGNPILVNGYIQTVSDGTLTNFYQQYLFEPLQINNIHFVDVNGGAEKNGGVVLNMRSQDLAKIGYLYLNKGRWQGQQIVSSSFIKDAVSTHVSHAEENAFYSYSYGYFWWLNPLNKLESEWKIDNTGIFLGRGAGGQHLIVWPSKELVCVITAWNLQRPTRVQTIFDRYVIPAVLGQK
ncbi:serine hydrolase domain-containing protein [Fodinibius saliphilus]|uniref:serine hydrolase domain-containing protein n=1 Tax=Fodinibius saliphilus TaxID=1920650 RepID=UPI0011098301|nr:serine hydrolase [Fodinibius saliphilus]